MLIYSDTDTDTDTDTNTDISAYRVAAPDYSGCHDYRFFLLLNFGEFLHHTLVDKTAVPPSTSMGFIPSLGIVHNG